MQPRHGRRKRRTESQTYENQADRWLKVSFWKNNQVAYSRPNFPLWRFSDGSVVGWNSANWPAAFNGNSTEALHIVRRRALSQIRYRKLLNLIPFRKKLWVP